MGCWWSTVTVAMLPLLHASCGCFYVLLFTECNSNCNNRNIRQPKYFISTFIKAQARHQTHYHRGNRTYTRAQKISAQGNYSAVQGRNILYKKNTDTRSFDDTVMPLAGMHTDYRHQESIKGINTIIISWGSWSSEKEGNY